MPRSTIRETLAKEPEQAWSVSAQPHRSELVTQGQKWLVERRLGNANLPKSRETTELGLPKAWRTGSEVAHSDCGWHCCA